MPGCRRLIGTITRGSRPCRAERQHCQETDKDNYGNIWEGECRSSVAGAIYSKEIAGALQAQRICPVPYDPRLKVHTIWDLGFNDSMSIILAQKVCLICG